MILANQKSPSHFFHIEKVEKLDDRLEYAVGSIEANVIAFVAGIIITLVASISPALKFSKQNIIDAIKYA